MQSDKTVEGLINIHQMLLKMIAIHNSRRNLMYFLFEKVAQTMDFEFYGRIFVNLYQEDPVNLVEVILTGRKLEARRRYCNRALVSRNINLTLWMQEEYCSSNV